MLRLYRRALGCAAAAFLLSASPLYAESAGAASAQLAGDRELKPGDYIWHPEAAEDGNLEIVVSIPLQVAYVYRCGTLIGVSTVSTGKPGHETPTGSFEILQKRREHYSNKYENAPMPFMQRLTWDGIAIHGGHIPGYPASHGCIRLPHAFAKALYGVTQMNQEVVVLQNFATPVKRPEPKIEPPVVQPTVPVPQPAPDEIPPASPAKPVV
jgi:hypothetical protein